MTNKLFVGNLPFSTTEEQLKDLFETAGEVEELKIVMDKENKRSRGYAFIDMKTEEEAENAIKMIHETELEGRKINVNIARSTGEKVE